MMQLFPAFSVFCKSGQEGYGIALRIGRLLVQIRQGLGMQSHYKAPDDLWVEIVETAVIGIS